MPTVRTERCWFWRVPAIMEATGLFALDISTTPGIRFGSICGRGAGLRPREDKAGGKRRKRVSRKKAEPPEDYEGHLGKLLERNVPVHNAEEDVGRGATPSLAGRI